MTTLKNLIEECVPSYSLVLPVSKKKIKYRPFLMKEQRVLYQVLETEDSEEITIQNLISIINNCILDGTECSELALPDFEYLFLHVRSKAESESFTFKTPCNHCGHHNEVTTLISDLQLDSGEELENPIKIAENIWVEMKLLSVGSLQESSKPDLITLVKSSIKSVIYKDAVITIDESNYADLDGFIDSLSKDQFLKLKKFVVNIPQNYMNINFKCEKCQEENDKKITGLINFFI